MISPQAFYDLVRPELPGIFEPMLDKAIMQIARTFCMKTRCWRDDFFTQATVAGQSEYDVGAAWGEPIAVHRLEVNGDLLYDLDNEPAAAYSRFRPPFRLSPDLGVITLDDNNTPGASISDGLVMSGSLWPSINAALLPDVLLYRFGDDMRLGVLARLMLMGNKPWTDRQLAPVYQAEFDAAIARAANLIAQGNQIASPSQSAQWDATTNSRQRCAASLDEENMALKSIELLNASAPAVGGSLTRAGTLWNYSLTVTGSGAVAAAGRIEVSLDGVDWLNWGSFSATGTDKAVDSLEPAYGAYPHQRAVLTAITGVNAVASIKGAGA